MGKGRKTKKKMEKKEREGDEGVAGGVGSGVWWWGRLSSGKEWLCRGCAVWVSAKKGEMGHGSRKQVGKKGKKCDLKRVT